MTPGDRQFLRTEFMTSALDVENGEIIDAHILTSDKETRRRQFICAACAEKGSEVGLTFVQGHKHTYKSDIYDPRFQTPAKIERVKDKPPHFIRKSGAPLHVCDHDVAYAPFRSTANFLNATLEDAGRRAYVFPIGQPLHGLEKKDITRGQDKALRFSGENVDAIRDARDLNKLLGHFVQHPSLIKHQAFADQVLGRRAIHDVYFEEANSLYQYLRIQEAFKPNDALICAYLFNPNNSFQARSEIPEKNGLVDRTNKKQPDGRRLNVFVRGENRQTIDEISNVSYGQGKYQKVLALIMGYCWIDDANHDPNRDHHIEFSLSHPRQIVPWEYHDVRFLQPGKDGGPQGDSQASLRL